MGLHLRARSTAFAAACVVFSSLFVPPGMTRTDTDPSGLELIGLFADGPPITGAVLHGDHLFVTSTSKLSIFDVGDPVRPTLVGSAISRNVIHGELLPTNGEILLLNDGLGTNTVDIWNVEDKSNPVLIATIPNLPDEHWSCVMDCSWAYGSTGSVLDLRDPAQPKKVSSDWTERAGISAAISIHRVDEYRPGYLVTAPREGPPDVVDARKPLHPRRVARAALPGTGRSGIIYSSWSLGGRSRYLLASVENQESGECSHRTAGTLLGFDTKGYPERSRFPFASRLRTASAGCRGSGAYFEPSPSFEADGLLALAYFRGLMVLRLQEGGRMKEMATFAPPVGAIWHTFWATDEVLYALNRTGEIYILKYS